MGGVWQLYYPACNVILSRTAITNSTGPLAVEIIGSFGSTQKNRLGSKTPVGTTVFMGGFYSYTQKEL